MKQMEEQRGKSAEWGKYPSAPNGNKIFRDVNELFFRDVGEISDFILSKALGLVMGQVRVMQPTTLNP